MCECFFPAWCGTSLAEPPAALAPPAFSLTTFSPTGKLGQIEHALQAVHKGKTCLGIQGAWQGQRWRRRRGGGLQGAAQRPTSSCLVFERLLVSSDRRASRGAQPVPNQFIAGGAHCVGVGGPVTVA